jgi:benzoate membrane transport protein
MRRESPNLPVIGMSLAVIVLIVTVLALPLAAGQDMGLSSAQLATWIAGLFGVPGVLGILLVYRYRQPLPITGTFAAIVLVAAVGARYGLGEMAGAFMVAGLLVLVLGVSGVTRRIARWIPEAVVWGLLAGAVFRFVIGVFAPLGDQTLIAGAILVTFLVARWRLGPQPISLLPAVVVGLGAAWLSGQFEEVPIVLGLPEFVLTWPVFTPSAIATLTPVVVVLMTAQANIPSAVVLRANGYDPPERAIDVVSGTGTVLASFLGPVAISQSLPAAALISGPEAGEKAKRHHIVYIVGVATVVVAVLAGAAAALAEMIPDYVLVALAGLAVLGIFVNSLQEMTKGPVVLGPIFAFAIVVADVTIAGYGAFFWALVIGVAVSLLLENEKAPEAAPKR